MAPQDGVQLDDVAAIDLSPLGKTNYAFSRQKLNEIIKMLRDCAIEEVIKLPKIAVIGNQSAGKSSLIEAISQIKVPRASGTCTRCPMEVMLRHSKQEWQGKVSLRFAQDDPRVRLSSLTPFAETKSKEDITIFLRRAQLAALNPGKPLEEFMDLSETQCDAYATALKFSKNTVVLEIIGADVDVTFIDLPGIISNTEDVCTPLK
jgi:vacuolar protein sorting-associated protein 1